jgi:hypothetical protein
MSADIPSRISIFIISIIRLKSLVTVSYEDITYSVPDALIWSMLEPSLGLTLASIPIMRPVFSKIFPDNTQQGNTGLSNTNPTSTSGLASKNFQRIDEYPLDSMRPDFSENRTYVTERRAPFYDMESQKSSQSEAELVTSNIKVRMADPRRFYCTRIWHLWQIYMPGYLSVPFKIRSKFSQSK